MLKKLSLFIILLSSFQAIVPADHARSADGLAPHRGLDRFVREHHAEEAAEASRLRPRFGQARGRGPSPLHAEGRELGWSDLIPYRHYTKMSVLENKYLRYGMPIESRLAGQNIVESAVIAPGNR